VARLGVDVTDIVIVAMIVGVTGILTPIVLEQIRARQRHAEKAEDWARQDLVADRVTEAAERAVEVAEQAAAAAALLVTENKKVAAATVLTNGKIDAVALQATEIHGLVNSAMSEEMRRNLESQESLLAVLIELQEVKQASGLSPSSDALKRIEATRLTISELRAALGDRFRATMAAAAAAAKDETP